MGFLNRLFGRSGPTAREEAAEAKGEEFGRQLYEKAEAFGQERLDQIAVNLLAVFKNQLQKTDPSGEHDATTVATVELEIFKDQIAEAQKRMWAELQAHLEPEIQIAEQVGGLDSAIADVIENAVQQRLDFLVSGAKGLYDMRLAELSKEA